MNFTGIFLKRTTLYRLVTEKDQGRFAPIAYSCESNFEISVQESCSCKNCSLPNSNGRAENAFSGQLVQILRVRIVLSQHWTFGLVALSPSHNRRCVLKPMLLSYNAVGWCSLTSIYVTVCAIVSCSTSLKILTIFSKVEVIKEGFCVQLRVIFQHYNHQLLGKYTRYVSAWKTLTWLWQNFITSWQ